MVSETTFTSGNLTERENTKNDNIFYGLWGDILSIANINAGREESFETKLGKKLTFPQPIHHTHHVYVKYVKTLLFSLKG